MRALRVCPVIKYIHESPHIWTEEIEIRRAPARLRQLCSEEKRHRAGEQAVASQVERALQAPVFQRCVYRSYRYLLDRLGRLRPELVELARSGPLGAQLQHRGRMISGSVWKQKTGGKKMTS